MLHFLIPSGDNCQTYRGLFLPPAKLLCYAQNLREELTDNLGKDRPPKQTASKSSEILLLSDLKTFSCLAKSEIIVDFLISFFHLSWCTVNPTEVLLLWQLTLKQAVNAFHLNHPAVSHGAAVARLWPPHSLTGHSSLYRSAFPQVLEKMNFWTGKQTLARNIS